MAKSIKEYLEENAEMRDRFLDKAFEQDSNIKNFNEFTDALNDAFNTARGQRVLDKLGDEEFKLLWESTELNARADFIKNRTDAGLPTNTDDEASDSYEVERRVEVGEPTKPKDIFVVPIQKNIEIKSYQRHGHRIHGYKRTYTKWSPAQRDFVYQYRRDGIPAKQLVTDFQLHFKESGKTSTGIRTRYYRAK